MRARPSLVPALALLVALAQGTQTSRRLSVAVLDENGVDVHESPPMIPECEIDADGAAPPYKTFRRLFDGFFRSAIQRARLSEAEVAAWLKSLEQADAEGVFQNGAVVFTVVGQKP